MDYIQHDITKTKSSHTMKQLEDDWALACSEVNTTWPPMEYENLHRPSGKAYSGRLILDCVEQEACSIVISPKSEVTAMAFQHQMFFQAVSNSIGKLST